MRVDCCLLVVLLVLVTTSAADEKLQLNAEHVLFKDHVEVLLRTSSSSLQGLRSSVRMEVKCRSHYSAFSVHDLRKVLHMRRLADVVSIEAKIARGELSKLEALQIAYEPLVAVKGQGMCNTSFCILFDMRHSSNTMDCITITSRIFSQWTTVDFLYKDDAFYSNINVRKNIGSPSRGVIYGKRSVVDEDPTPRQYHNYTQLVQFLQELNAKYPNITQLESIGKSVDGRDMWVSDVDQNFQIRIMSCTIDDASHDHSSVDILRDNRSYTYIER